jgi:glycosidase
LTHEGPALIYYGDEIGLPGYHDPDNRQMMVFGEECTGPQQDVLSHVQTLTHLRKTHPELIRGDKKVWWSEADLLGVSRVSEEGFSLVLINRGIDERLISNALSWADLPTTGTYTDQLTMNTFSPVGDQLSLQIPSKGALLLTWSE